VLGMVDLTPQALGVEADSIRVFLTRRASSTDFKDVRALFGPPSSFSTQVYGTDPAPARLREAAKLKEGGRDDSEGFYRSGSRERSPIVSLAG
jgi:hypothetical protein